MSNLNIYSRILISINGALLSEEASVTITRNPGLQDVDTVAKGFAGMSPGSAKIQISVDSAVPSAGFELDPGPFMSNAEVVELSLFIPGSGLSLVSKGFIVEDNFSHAVDSASKLSFQFRGEWAQWE